MIPVLIGAVLLLGSVVSLMWRELERRRIALNIWQRRYRELQKEATK
jgi:hypothetical protein